ncbi:MULTISPECIES: alpha/beta hydrolase [unclassified Leptolyngbya]|uniref:alpha/beta hydrolase n=1 Tax=unclassified Leptolyngbya TaxID=2650499 RepID=UPI001683472A|nr:MULTISPECIES: alpha/beta hydrolase [unclassified Leptolyngbya]MBD1911621.1 alpha/beta hydrolase [Leptolyngbya sp. FACHB-8]MBD2153186.1 alpha/beta hydrolase [Leptolyngbya sp. FACHB-16]
MPFREPNVILFLQHGWADDNRAMLKLGEQLAIPGTEVVASSLNYVQTWLRIDPLIQEVEAIAQTTMARHPGIPLRIVGHSMGGLIWLEVLNRNPSWRANVHSLVLVGSPVGGADLGRILDPLQVGVGIAGDLGKNRKALAAHIAAIVPTLIIAGDLDGGSDGVVPVECTRFPHAQFVRLPGISHPALRSHSSVAATIREFWVGLQVGEAVVLDDVIHRLHAVPGMTDGHMRDFAKSKVLFHLKNGGTLRTWTNVFGVAHVFVADAEGTCRYAGFVGWLHNSDLQRAIANIHQDEHLSIQ